MAGVTRIDIQESVEELALLIRQQKQSRQKERLQALYMIKSEGMSVSAIATTLGKHRSCVQRWLADYRESGIEKMLLFGKSSGRSRVIPNWAVESIKKQLENPEIGFASYKGIQQWLRNVLGVEAEYATVHHLVRYQLNTKLKVPRPRNSKQDKEKLEVFKKPL
jgi:transposase